MNRRSIRFRLTAWYSLCLAVTFAIAGIGVWLALEDSIHDTVDRELRARLGEVRQYLEKERREGNQPAEELAEDAAFTPAGTRFRIASADGRWLYQSPRSEFWGSAPDAAKLRRNGTIETIKEQGKPVRVLSAASPDGIIQIGIPLDEFSEMQDGFALTALLASPVLLLLASAGGYWMSRRALAPVETITSAAGEIEAKDLSQRLPVRGSGDELDQLSTKLNGMFARLDSSFRRIAQFTADASHELRTPVSIIRTTAEVTLARPRAPEEYARALEQILAESERTTALVEDLMLLARADAREQDAVDESVDLAEVARDAAGDAQRTAPGRAVNVTAGTSRPVRGDAESLRRLAFIFLDNAIKYSAADSPVDIRVEARDALAMLEVRDRGIGIAAEDLPHVFDRFYRASKDRSRRVDGFGLGLSIAREIAARHGGRIEVESREGSGSVFRALFPGMDSWPRMDTDSR